jgi:hypothetical protein
MSWSGAASDELDTFDDSFDVGPGGDPRHPADAAIPKHGHAADAATVAALGKLAEAVEWIERARGRLYDFHQLTGHADELMVEAAEALELAGHGALAAEVRDELVGRNVLAGRWTFQVVDEYDDTYWMPVRDLKRKAERELAGGSRHLYESGLKEQRRTHGKRHHEATPADADDPAAEGAV